VPLATLTSFPTPSGPAAARTNSAADTLASVRRALSDRTNFLSWDCPKIAPPPYFRHEVHSQKHSPPRRRLSPSERSSQLRPRSVLTLSQRPDGFLLRGGACVLQHATSHGVRRVSAHETSRSQSPDPSRSHPRDAFPPFEVAPPHSGELPSLANPRGSVTAPHGHPRGAFTAPLAPPSFPSRPAQENSSTWPARPLA